MLYQSILGSPQHTESSCSRTHIRHVAKALGEMIAKHSPAHTSCPSMVQADRPNSLDCGTLYGAEFIQLSDVNGGNFSIEWVDMGHACQADLLPHVENTTIFDIFDWQPYDNTTASGCPQNMLSVNTGAKP